MNSHNLDRSRVSKVTLIGISGHKKNEFKEHILLYEVYIVLEAKYFKYSTNRFPAEHLLHKVKPKM